jgi:hypothetical protein
MLYKKCLPPLLTAPANNVTGQNTSLTLSWSVYSDTTADKATRYKVQVSTSSTFAATVVDDSSATTGSLPISGLTINTTYFWRVAGKNTAGGLGTWSPVRTFTVGAVGISNQKAHYSMLPAGTRGMLEVYQASGTRIAEIAYDASSKVTKSMLLSNAKAGLAQGCYTYRLRIDSKVVESGSFIKK